MRPAIHLLDGPATVAGPVVSRGTTEHASVVGRCSFAKIELAPKYRRKLDMETSRNTNLMLDKFLGREIRAFQDRIACIMKKVYIKDRHLLLLIVALSAFLRCYQILS